MSDPTSLIERALDPARSVVVEGCAGSGKTWLLASRIVRLLLAGVAPGEILAITFTRKAAREIEQRVVVWLHLLATGSEAQLGDFLAERGVVTDKEALRTARGLIEGVLAAQGAVQRIDAQFCPAAGRGRPRFDAAPDSTRTESTQRMAGFRRRFARYGGKSHDRTASATWRQRAWPGAERFLYR